MVKAIEIANMTKAHFDRKAEELRRITLHYITNALSYELREAATNGEVSYREYIRFDIDKALVMEMLDDAGFAAWFEGDTLIVSWEETYNEIKG